MFVIYLSLLAHNIRACQLPNSNWLDDILKMPSVYQISAENCRLITHGRIKVYTK